MDAINIHQAKPHLSRLVEKAARGESFIIAKAGKPMVKVVPLDALDKRPIKRMEGEIHVPRCSLHRVNPQSLTCSLVLETRGAAPEPPFVLIRNCRGSA
jgi:prevent-host-death family protein